MRNTRQIIFSAMLVMAMVIISTGYAEAKSISKGRSIYDRKPIEIKEAEYVFKVPWGATYSGYAYRFYGDANFAGTLAKMNNSEDPDKLFAGSKIRLPYEGMRAKYLPKGMIAKSEKLPEKTRKAEGPKDQPAAKEAESPIGQTQEDLKSQAEITQEQAASQPIGKSQAPPGVTVLQPQPKKEEQQQLAAMDNLADENNKLKERISKFEVALTNLNNRHLEEKKKRKEAEAVAENMRTERNDIAGQMELAQEKIAGLEKEKENLEKLKLSKGALKTDVWLALVISPILIGLFAVVWAVNKKNSLLAIIKGERVDMFFEKYGKITYYPRYIGRVGAGHRTGFETIHSNLFGEEHLEPSTGAVSDSMKQSLRFFFRCRENPETMSKDDSITFQRMEGIIENFQKENRLDLSSVIFFQEGFKKCTLINLIRRKKFTIKRSWFDYFIAIAFGAVIIGALIYFILL